MKSLIRTYRLIPVILLLLFSFIPSLSAQDYNEANCYGGKKLLKVFISEEMVYPKEAIRKKQEGTVKLTFVVNPQGVPVNVKITQPVSPLVDSEAIRIFKKILWKPAYENAIPVDAYQGLEIDFNIKNYKKIVKKRGYDQIKYPYKFVDSSFTIYQSNEVEIIPQAYFTDGSSSATEFFAEHMKYPQAAFNQNITGQVKLLFVVEPHGKISNIKIVNGLGGGCSEEAIRLLRLVKWHPGIHNNKACRVQMPITIDFNQSSNYGAVDKY